MKLSLRREALTALTTDELAGLAGGTLTPTTAFEVNSLDPLTTCVAAVRESVLYCSGQACNTWNSDCSCAI